MQIQYSKNCTQIVDIEAFCNGIAETILSLGPYPLGGLRVRATEQDFAVIADGHSENAFIDMVFRIGQGRSAEDKKRTGEAVMAKAEDLLGTKLTSGHFMLSLEIVEISREHSWKINSVHKRLKQE